MGMAFSLFGSARPQEGPSADDLQMDTSEDPEFGAVLVSVEAAAPPVNPEAQEEQSHDVDQLAGAMEGLVAADPGQDYSDSGWMAWNSRFSELAWAEWCHTNRPEFSVEQWMEWNRRFTPAEWAEIQARYSAGSQGSQE